MTIRRVFCSTNITLHRAVLVIALFLIWETAARLHWLDPDFFSPPSAVFEAILRLANPSIAAAAGITVLEVLYAYTLAATAGIIFGLIVGLSPFAYSVFHPIILLLFAIPKMVMLPLFILFFGIGMISKSVFAFTLGVFPIVLNVITGTRTVDPILITAAHSMGASRAAIFLKVIIPAALPSVITGLRLGMTQTVLGVLLAELYGASSGLGYYVMLYTQSFRPAEVFALFFVIAMLAIIVNECLRLLEQRAGQWREEEAEGIVI